MSFLFGKTKEDKEKDEYERLLKNRIDSEKRKKKK